MWAPLAVLALIDVWGIEHLAPARAQIVALLSSNICTLQVKPIAPFFRIPVCWTGAASVLVKVWLGVLLAGVLGPHPSDLI
jgi:hypothetical protein